MGKTLKYVKENPVLAAVRLFHLIISVIKPHHFDERKKNVYAGPP